MLRIPEAVEDEIDVVLVAQAVDVEAAVAVTVETAGDQQMVELMDTVLVVDTVIFNNDDI